MNPHAPIFVPSQQWPSAATASTATINGVTAYTDTFPQNGRLTAFRGFEEASKDEVVASVARLQCLLERLAGETILSVDCEGADLSKGSWRDGECLGDQAAGPLHGGLCLMQIGTMIGEAYAIDILELGPIAFDMGLRRMLESREITKIVHDFRQDADALWHQFRVHANGLFDCQLCDVLIRRLSGHRTTYVQGSARLFTAYGIEVETIPGYGRLTQEQKLRIHERFSEDRHLWERRPLPADLVRYAKADVMPLPALYHKLLQALSHSVGEEALARRLVKVGSSIYNAEFVEQRRCCCRLCCNASENARFDGSRVMSRIADEFEAWVLKRLWRPEDAQPLVPPGPSKFYVNEWDESVPLLT